MELFINYQSDLMLILSAICVLLAIFSLITNYISVGKRKALLLMTSSAALLMICDRASYAFQGDMSTFGFFMVRVSNFMVYLAILVIFYAFNEYLIEFAIKDCKMETIPKGLGYIRVIIGLGIFTLIVSQFMNFYYTIDSNNVYRREGGFGVSYVFPAATVIIHYIVAIKHFRKRFRIFLLGLICMSFSVIAATIQYFNYGISLVNVTLAGSVIAFYILTIIDANKIYRKANEQKIKFLEDKHKHSREMLLQTSEALATAIDAKDNYTNGHSLRVARYSEMIAKRIGKTEEELELIYIAGLLHDIGKIGIPDYVIGKEEKLTDEEFAMIREHPNIGKRILSKLDTSPDICYGASYHHERYDGNGYPEGLAGGNIPEIARIIAVADAYDAMTSRRSYRDILPQKEVRNEIAKGIGTQFDPRFAMIMLKIIDEDELYSLRQTMRPTASE